MGRRLNSQFINYSYTYQWQIAEAETPFSLKSRVIMLDTFARREQTYGYREDLMG